MSQRPQIRQTIKQKQTLIMSNGMKQAFLVLQMPILELSSWLDKEITTNPLLEFSPPHPKTKCSHPYRWSLICSKPTLYQHLTHEIGCHFKNTKEKELATYIAGSLDERGFLTLSEQEICLDKQVSSLFFRHVLNKFQQIEPLGLGARDVRESLQIQLKAQSKEKNLIYHLVEHHFNDLIQNRIGKLAKKFHLTPKKIKSMITKDLRPLCPFPGHQFLLTPPCPVIPDLFLEREGDIWTIRVDEDPLPTFHFNPLYLSRLKQTDCSREEGAFIRRYLTSGKWLSHILGRRKALLRSIGIYLLKHQEPFLDGLSSSPVPMTMGEMARALEVNSSTITRAIANKYLVSPQGVIKLRDLFTQKIQTEQGPISNQRAKNLLIQCIKNENKQRPLSDQKLAEQLSEQGILCARRTVTKYRRALKIPSSIGRRTS